MKKIAYSHQKSEILLNQMHIVHNTLTGGTRKRIMPEGRIQGCASGPLSHHPEADAGVWKDPLSHPVFVHSCRQLQFIHLFIQDAQPNRSEKRRNKE